MRFNIRESVETDSEGNPLSPEQIEFFKNSKIRDGRNGRGKLLVCYHGTDTDFDTFEKGDIGFHFGTLDAANDRKSFKDNPQKWNNKVVYLNIKHPMYVDYDIGDWDGQNVANHIIESSLLDIDDEEIRQLQVWVSSQMPSSEKTQLVKSFLIERGIDGIVYVNAYEDADSESYIAFYPNQIKSITNKTPTNSDNINEESCELFNKGLKEDMGSLNKKIEHIEHTNEDIDLPDNLLAYLPDGWWNRPYEKDDNKDFEHPWVGKEVKVEDAYYHPYQVIVARSKPYVNDSSDFIYTVPVDEIKKGNTPRNFNYYHTYDGYSWNQEYGDYSGDKGWKFTGKTYKIGSPFTEDTHENKFGKTNKHNEGFSESKGLKEDMELNFDRALLDKWIDDLNANGAKYHQTFSYTEGGKYIKVSYTYGGRYDTAVFAFVDADGNIYKPAGWKTPAKGVRARIDQNPPMDEKDLYSARYRAAVYGESVNEAYTKDSLHSKLWNMGHKEQTCFQNGYCVTCYFHDGEGMAKRYTVTNRDGKKVLDCNAGFAWQPQIQKFEDSLLQLLNTGSIKEEILTEGKFVRLKGTTKTAQGYEVIGYCVTSSGRLYAVVYRPTVRDYLVAAGYNKERGDWAQGYYDFTTEEQAIKKAEKLSKMYESVNSKVTCKPMKEYWYDEDSYFSHEQLVEFGGELEDEMQNQLGKAFEVGGVWLENGDTLDIDIVFDRDWTETFKQKIDFRKVKTQHHLNKYIPTLIDAVRERFKDAEVNEDFHNTGFETIGISQDDVNEFTHNLENAIQDNMGRMFKVNDISLIGDTVNVSVGAGEYDDREPIYQKVDVERLKRKGLDFLIKPIVEKTIVQFADDNY